jgi:hypothetical protein
MFLRAFISLFPLVIDARHLCDISGHHDVGAPLITLSKQIAGQCYIREQLVDILQRANFQRCGTFEFQVICHDHDTA